MKQEFYVCGTQCASCEILIERELLKHKDIISVKASHKKNTLQFIASNNRVLKIDELNQLLEGHDYTVTDKKQKANRVGGIQWQRIGAVIILTLSLYIIADKIGLLNYSPSSANPTNLIGVLVIGLIASLSSCTAVVGGLVAAVSSAVAKSQKNMTAAQRFRPHIYFNIGRIAGFFAFGVVVGIIGSAFQLDSTLNGIFVVAIALFMILIGINLLELFPVQVFRMPKWLAHRVHALAESQKPAAPMILGAATFFLPCGFTQSMQLFALTLQNPLQSGLIMAVFALGTTPVLLGIGKAATSVSANTLKKLTQAAGIIVLILGISNATNGLTLLGMNPSLAFATDSSNQNELPIKNGVQKISMELTSRGTYNPSVLTVQKDIPVEWTITAPSFMGCGDSLILPAFDVQENLKTGKNTVKFTPTKTGKYTFSCSMGMIRGVMIVKE